LKKLQALFLVFMLVVLCANPALASSNKNEFDEILKSKDVIQDVLPDSIYDKYVNDNNVDRFGNIGIEAIVDYYLYVPIFNQGDSRWKNDIMLPDGYTIGAKGCALTSTAMVFKYFGVNTDPGVLNQEMGDAACPFNWWAAPSRAGHGMVELLTVRGDSNQTEIPLVEFYNIAVAALEDGNPVIIGMVKPNGGTHFVTVKAVYGDGVTPDDYTVNDPAGGVVRKLDYYIEDLGWYIYRIVVYGRI